MTSQLSELDICQGGKREEEGRKSAWADQREEGRGEDSVRGKRRQPRGNKFETATPLICLVLSATDKLGETGEEGERSDEKENKEHLISPAGASVRERSSEEKLYQLARPLQSPRFAAGSFEVVPRNTIYFFNPNSQIDSCTLLYWASASEHARGCTREHTPTYMPVDTQTV